MNPTDYLKRQRTAARRAADPNTPIRLDFKQIMRAAGLHLSDWSLNIRRSRKHPWQASGTTHYLTGRIAVTLGVGVDRARWRALLLHEVAHALTGCVRLPGLLPPIHHGTQWRSTFVELTRVSYGVSMCSGFCSSHDLHDAIEEALRADR